MSKIKTEVIETDFGLAPIQKEGEPVWNPSAWELTGPSGSSFPKTKYQTDWLERRVPEELYEEAHEVLDQWLISKGINLEDL